MRSFSPSDKKICHFYKNVYQIVKNLGVVGFYVINVLLMGDALKSEQKDPHASSFCITIFTVLFNVL